jgi:hypothetical protein
MKSFFFALLLANLVAGAWLWLQAPVDVVREPGRMDLQIEPARIRVLSEAEVAGLRQKAQSDAAKAAPPPQAPAAVPAAAAPAVADLPLASCIDIGTFGSEAATKKIRSRLNAAGLGERLAVSTADKITRLRITGVDPAGEAQVHVILHDFPKQEMTHCDEAPAAH